MGCSVQRELLALVCRVPCWSTIDGLLNDEHTAQGRAYVSIV